MNKINVKLGQATNLLYGYDPSWLSQEAGNNTLFPVSKVPLEEKEIEFSKEIGQWGPFPVVSLHDNAISLLDELVPYQIHNPTDSTKSVTPKAGLLLIGDADSEKAKKKLSETLGIDISNENYGFALVKLERNDSNVAHAINYKGLLMHPSAAEDPDVFGDTREFREAISQLKRIKQSRKDILPNQITKEIANQYLDFYNEQGSHFVSNVALGDTIFQIFAMPQDRYNKVKDDYKNKQEQLSGADAINFMQYTSSQNNGVNGYVKEYGKVLNFSQSQTLTDDLHAGDWIENSFAYTNSIFALYQFKSKIRIPNLDRSYTDVAAIKTELTPLSLYVDNDRKKIWQRIIKNAITQKYQGAVAIAYIVYNEIDLSDKLAQGQLPGTLSNIATPYINMYKTSLDLNNLQIVAGKEVKEFTLYSNYLYANQNEQIEIPGNNVLINAQKVALEQLEHAPVLNFTNKGYKNVSFSSQHFLGALVIRNKTTTDYFTYADGLKYTSVLGTHGRTNIKVIQDIRKEINNHDSLERIKSSLQFNYAFVESSINTVNQSTKSPLKHFLRKSLLWISKCIPKNTQDADLLNLRIRSLDLAHLNGDKALGTFVPILPYHDYKTQVDSILDYVEEINKTMHQYNEEIENRKTDELAVTIGKKLNENIVNSGRLLAKYIDTSLAQQKDMSAYYAAIINQKQGENKRQQKKVTNLRFQVDSQKNEVKNATENYKQAIEDYQITAAVNFALDIGINVAENIFSPIPVIPDIPDPSEVTELTEEAKALKKDADRVQKLLDAIDKVNNFYDKASATVDDMQSAQDTLDGLTDVLSANLQWDELKIKMKRILASGPDDSEVKEAQGALQDAFDILILRGKTYTIAKSKQQQTARELYNQQCQKDLVKDQVARLKQLNTNLNPSKIEDLDISKIDLIGMTGSLSLIRSQILGVLAKTFILQDEVLQYTNLQPATPIQSFDILGIKGAIAKQNGITINAKTLLAEYQASTTIPIDIEIEVPISELQNGAIYQFDLLQNIPQFSPYVDVRVESVVAKIDGIKSTESNQYFLELRYNGRPFYDRGTYREQLVFNTLSRHHTYQYKVDKNQPLFSKDDGKAWSNEVTPITPFSEWQISLPKNHTNKGIIFEDILAKVTLTFVLKTRIHDIQNKMVLEEINDMVTKPSIDSLKQQMAGESVLNGWDVVFNMELKSINDSLKDQYKQLQTNPTFNNTISTSSGIPIGKAGKTDIDKELIQKFDFIYGYPELEFLLNNPGQCKLNMQITDGTFQQGTRYIGENNLQDKKKLEEFKDIFGITGDIKTEQIGGKEKLVLEDYKDPIKMSPDAKLTAIISLSKVKGIVNNDQNILSVVLDMSKGAFSAAELKIEMNDEEKVKFGEAIKGYFIEHKVSFILNTLNMNNISGIPALQPNAFLFKTLTTGMGNKILQLFIQTNGDALLTSTANINIQDPIPEGSDTSLMINNKVFFNEVLPVSILPPFQCKGSNEKDENGLYYSKFTKADVSCDIDLSNLYESYPSYVQGKNLGYDINYYPLDSPSIFKFSGMTMKANSNIHLNFDNSILFHYEKDKDGYYGDSKKTHETKINITINSNLPITLSGSGRSQKINIQVDKSNINIEGKSGGSCKKLEDTIRGQIHDKLTPKLLVALNTIKFKSISIFALKNLLFPTNNYIDMKDISVPSDVLITGVFNKE